MSIGLTLQNVGRSFKSPGGTVVALEDVNLTIAPGELVALVGPSGCGKSTLLRAVAGLDREYSGEILADGVPILGPDLARGIIFQEPRLFPWLALSENVGFGLRGSAAARNDRIRELISLVGLAGFEKAYPHQLSGGMAQRAAIARALAPSPGVLLLDEPFGALDHQTRALMQELLLAIWEADRKTVLFVTHDIDEAIFMGNRVCVMTARPGRIKADRPISLDYPRHYTMKTTPAFSTYKAELTEDIRAESIKAAQFDPGARAH